MTRQDEMIERETLHRQALQKEMLVKFGITFINKKRKEFCSRCSTPACFLYPITSEGADCPYFADKASLSE